MANSDTTTHICQQCGAGFSRKPDKHKKFLFCSLKCYHDSTRIHPDVNKDCEYCGEPMQKRASKDRARRYCSPECAALGKRQHFEQPCEECRTAFTPDKAGRRFCSLECRDKHWSGGNHPNWQTGRSIQADGYVLIKMPSHPRAHSDGYIFEHIVVAEQAIGRYLVEGEIVHHIDHDTENNEPSNLQVMSRSEHSRLHSNERWHGRA